MAQITFGDILHDLEGQEFRSYRELLDAVRKVFNQHVLEFPPGYTHLDVLEYGQKNNWIEGRSDQTYVVHVNSLPTLRAPGRVAVASQG